MYFYKRRFIVYNLIICNNFCKAGCYHCPYSKDGMVSLDEITSVHYIFDIDSDLVILSGGEPFELEYSALHKYISMCVICKKYFRIATGGHINIKPYLGLLKSILFFSGLQFGTDVISRTRNINAESYKDIWKANINDCEQNSIDYSITITLSKDFDLEDVLVQIQTLLPSFILLNFIDFDSTAYIDEINLIRNAFPLIEIKYGYTG